MFQMGFLKLLYGADMREYPEQYPCEFGKEPPYEIVSNPWLSQEDIRVLKNCEDALDRLYNSGRFLCSLTYLTEEVGISPFDLFCEFGNAVCGNRTALSDYTEAFYRFFRDRCDEDALRDALMCDLLCSSSSAQIPAAFKRQGALYKRAKKYFANHIHPTVKIAVLPTKGQIFTVDPRNSKNLHNRYEGTFYNIDDVQVLFGE